MQHKNRFSRVDIQVSILTGIIVIVACGAVFALSYMFSYNEMIDSLTERVTSIYDYLDTALNKQSFNEISSIEDEKLEAYTESKQLLENVKNATGVMYLYTAKRLEDGSFIYLVDGLPTDSPDFRHAGDLIEPEIIPDMESALNNNLVLPDEIKPTSWGHIFICYFPIHDGNEVTGVLGIEFDAGRQYDVYRLLLIGTPLVIVLACLIAIILAVILFRRISNPTFHDMSNTDLLTGLKNRNAFETDIGNLNKAKSHDGIAVISIDLDNLKIVNDSEGHSAGDQYIVDASKILRGALPEKAILYRTGGDEFTVILHSTCDNQLEELVNSFERDRQEFNSRLDASVEFSIGASLFNSNDDDLFSTFRTADRIMYENKASHKEKAKIHSN